ncbi:MAG: formate dehydrogenase subunit delta [Rhodospirillales bacterium]|nr:formate dehydrogenase subunit delta [Rhodospirillales bacterium]
MDTERLTYMANQIGKFFAHAPEAQAVAAIEQHIRQFWEPRMRSAILAADGAGLDPLPRAAVERLRLTAQAPRT